MTRLAVLGSPIAHSLSPALHAAAYRELRLDWRYEAIDVPEGALGAFLNTLDDDWRGLSLTMPLKREVLPMLTERSALVELVGAANTVLLGDGVRGSNTDVDGIVDALADHGIVRAGRVHILGMGATAASTLVAAERLGAPEVVVTGRRAADDELQRIADALQLPLRFRAVGDPAPEGVDLLVNTVPGDLIDVIEVDDAGAFLEVHYADGPSPRTLRWTADGRPVVSGLEMLLHQAVRQVRIFATGDDGAALPDEPRVLTAMRAAVGL
ncbi:shikimate dehydrogenase family protein [Pseudolysinimonas sp.]|uniref:shikimate dehydrogenase family protein n=1 Tax=Pseudolysinimonas sp. TaxID=2680009 RepID=UPI003F7EF4A7